VIPRVLAEPNQLRNIVPQITNVRCPRLYFNSRQVSVHCAWHMHEKIRLHSRIRTVFEMGVPNFINFAAKAKRKVTPCRLQLVIKLVAVGSFSIDSVCVRYRQLEILGSN